MNIKQILALTLTISITALASCKKDKDPEPEVKPDFEQVSKYIKKYNSGVIEVTQLPIPDTTDANIRSWTLFNFDKMEFVASSKIASGEWDFGFQGKTVSVIWANNGLTGDEESPNWEGPGRVYVKSFFSKFDDMEKVPDGVKFEVLDNSRNVIGSAAENRQEYTQFAFYWAYNEYNIDKEFSHKVPFTNNIHVFKLTDGRYVKIQLINTYNNTPDKNSVKSRPGYLSFRYYISKAGSTDLKTK
ncbi:MAG: HmuY family protein [Bacteroidota bacterium]